MNKNNIDTVIAMVKETKGLDLRGYRRNMLERRIQARVKKLLLPDIASYLRMLRATPGEYEALIDEIGINVSVFFRDPIVFEILHQKVLPGILAEKRRKARKEIRVWSVGCSAGEEPYSIAILIHKALEKEKWVPYIFATDIDTSALKTAGTAIYPRESFEDTKLGILDTYFTPNNNGYAVKSFIKDMVQFSRKDCTSTGIIAPADSVFATFDLVLCRNVLIYFTPDLQKNVLTGLGKTIAPGGYLVMGDSESLNGEFADHFKDIDKKNNIYRK
ncbi:MAG: protein-glutamate O-methyltransferase CheR, partial [bacterium]|nr:protein-glutamate O-methyltransferase CheR [bacterium]